MVSFKNVLSRLALSLYFSMAGLLVFLTMESKSLSSSFTHQQLLLGLVLAGLHFADYFVVLSAGRDKFVKIYTAGAFVAALSTFILAFFVYQEPLLTMFHVIGVFMLILTFRYEFFRIPGRLRDNAKTLMYILIFVEVCVSIWVRLHAIFRILITPESAAKWILLNAYTAGYLFIGLFAIRSSQELMNRRVVLNKYQLVVDETDYTQLFGSSDLLVLTFFAKEPGRPVTCAEMFAGFAENPIEQMARQSSCAECVAEHHKATLCVNYRRIYNQVLKIKKILETLGIGTIVQPQNKMAIISDGWALKVFQSVTIIEKS
ncbi:MAG TPA: hypothetical protein PK074_02455 [Spirochaetales bacterium]|nr:hypothetical protein [Spirochaetales bacterium]HPD80003.1 hypothetical protein [Spirochaetales bacterium]HQK33561.1 hypothetical protein [Spirochaetales bacterium]HRV28157.1 hypothetical protein [Spirochaetia bacterium]